MIARVPDDSDARYCFRLRCLEISRNVVVNCRKLFRPQKFDSCSSCRTRGSITCITRIRICIFLNSGAFCILSKSVTRNEIMSIGAFTDNYLNQMIYSDCRRMWFGNCWNPIGRIFSGRPKISFEKVSSRPASYGICDIVSASLHTLCC